MLFIFHCSKLVSNLGHHQEKSFFYKVFKIVDKRSDEKWTGNTVYPFVAWKLFSGIQVSSTDHYMISAFINTWHWALNLGDIC